MTYSGRVTHFMWLRSGPATSREIKLARQRQMENKEVKEVSFVHKGWHT